jgi:hypothetical protein
MFIDILQAVYAENKIPLILDPHEQHRCGTYFEYAGATKVVAAKGIFINHIIHKQNVS